jgi:hypothetical protein
MKDQSKGAPKFEKKYPFLNGATHLTNMEFINSVAATMNTDTNVLSIFDVYVLLNRESMADSRITCQFGPKAKDHIEDSARNIVADVITWAKDHYTHTYEEIDHKFCYRMGPTINVAVFSLLGEFFHEILVDNRDYKELVGLASKHEILQHLQGILGTFDIPAELLEQLLGRDSRSTQSPGKRTSFNKITI